MKTPLLLLAAICLSAAGCASPEDDRREAAEDAREDARRAAEDRRHESASWEDYLTDYAHRLGKAVSELTSAQRAEARHLYERDYRY